MIGRALQVLNELLLFPLLVLAALVSRHARRKFDVGFGPLPIVSHMYHKKAVQQAGYTAETFVDDVYFITSEFDQRLDRWKIARLRYGWGVFRPLYIFWWIATRYRCLAFYFDGGPISWRTELVWRWEPLLYRLAGIRTIVFPYGADVQDMTRSPNLLFKHTMTVDYPGQGLRRRRIDEMIDLWTANGDFVISGCEWVDYMYQWDKLVTSHIPIDLSRFTPPPREQVSAYTAERPLRLLHAPNHKAIKGSDYFAAAVDALRAEGRHIELVLVQRVPNDELKGMIAHADVILDQLVVGWYAMFAMEAMALGKPVVCYLRPDLLDLYTATGLVADPTEIPIVNTDWKGVKDALTELYESPERVAALGERSLKYVAKHHSTEAMSVLYREALGRLL